ncbi:MAG: hypothetical protein Q8P18_33860 [Pseudomonadota bacterium]|nr:hypothetical protein [Pseudomonadota bacterium]
MLWLIAPFVHTPPLAPPGPPWEVAFLRREDMTRQGVWCAWEAESLLYDGKPLWSAEPPEGEHWCLAPFEAARMVDVLGENGPYLSVRLTEWACCPDREAITRAVTYDLRTGVPTTLEAYDPRYFSWRTKRLQRILDRNHGGGWSVDPTAFVVDGRHVRVWATRGGEAIEIPLR